MLEFGLTPLTDAELYELIGAGILTMAMAAIGMVGLWVLFRPEADRENRRLSRIQHIVTWLGRHGASWRIL